MIDNSGKFKSVHLGHRIDIGQEPQLIIPAGTIFGAYLNEPDSFTLMGCMVSPGFDFKDFKLLNKNELISKYPQHRQIIEKLT
jgi:predicted cupin superfamily sugar epimerase